MATLYRLFIWVCTLASLAACSRASYQFVDTTAYLPASAMAAPSEPAVLLAELPRPTHTTLALLPLPKATGSSPPRAHKYLLAKHQLLKKKTQLVAWPAPQRNIAGAGPYFSGSDFGAFFLLLALYVLLIVVLIGGTIALLVKLIMHFTRAKPRRVAQSPAMPHPGP